MIEPFVSSDCEDTVFSPRQERRGVVRYRLPVDRVERSALAAAFRSFEGVVLDVSTTGVGLMLHNEVEVGTKVFVQLRARNGQGGDSPDLVARVKCTARHQDGGWLVWCVLKNALSDEQVRAWR